MVLRRAGTVDHLFVLFIEFLNVYNKNEKFMFLMPFHTQCAEGESYQ